MISKSRISALLSAFCIWGDSWAAKRSSALLLIGILAFGLLVVQILRHYTFETNACDLRLHEELVRNTWKGKFLYSDLLGHSFLSHHVSLIFPLLGFLYPLWPDPLWLLILQGILVGGAAWFLWLLARAYALRPIVAFTLVAVFFTYRGTLSGYFRGFQQEVVSIFFVLGFLWALTRRHPGSAIMLGLLALSCREDIAVPFAVLGAMLCFRKGTRLWGSVIFLVCLAWMLVAYGWVIPRHATRGQIEGISRWSQYGATPGTIAVGLISRPLVLLGNLFNRGVIRLLRRLFFLPLFDPWTVIPLFVPWAVHTSSSFSQQANLGGAYAALFVPFLFAGAIRTLTSRSLQRKLRSDGLTLLLCAGLIFSNLQRWPLPKDFSGVREAHRGLALINKTIAEKRVLAQGSIIPHIGWPGEYAMLGLPQAKPFGHYDLILLSERQDPWPLTPQDISAIRARLSRSREWKEREFGPITCFSKESR